MRTEYGLYSGRPSGWAVVNTHPHREHVALENLQRQEFWAYCPSSVGAAAMPAVWWTSLRPLFPGYLFVKILRDVQRWRPLLSTEGIRSVVRCGEELSLLGDAFVRVSRHARSTKS